MKRSITSVEGQPEIEKEVSDGEPKIKKEVAELKPEIEEEDDEEPLDANDVSDTSSPSYESLADLKLLLQRNENRMVHHKKKMVVIEERQNIAQLEKRIAILKCKLKEVEDIDYEKELKKVEDKIILVNCTTVPDLGEFMRDETFAMKMECIKREKEILKTKEEVIEKKFKFKERFGHYRFSCTCSCSKDSKTNEELEKQRHDKGKKLKVLKFKETNNERLALRNSILSSKFEGNESISDEEKLKKVEKEIEEAEFSVNGTDLEYFMQDKAFAMEMEILQNKEKVLEQQKELIEFKLENQEVLARW